MRDGWRSSILAIRQPHEAFAISAVNAPISKELSKELGD
jgi:hypothetical protein